MQIENYSSNQISELIAMSKRIAIVPSKTSGLDAFCAGVSLYYMLKEQEKDASLLYVGKVPDGCNDLISKNEIVSNIFQRELWVSIDYSDLKDASAHYVAEDGLLHLKLTPVNKGFDMSKVKTRIVGFEYDLVITLGVQDPEDLGQLWSELHLDFKKSKILNIDNFGANKRYGLLNIIEPTMHNVSMIVYTKAVEWGLVPTVKSARALLTGISHRMLVDS